MIRNGNGTHAGTTASVRNGKGLMQVEMANIGTYQGRFGKPHLRIHVGAVHVYLSPCIVDNPHHLLYGGFKYTMGGRISNHEGRQVLTMSFRFLLQITDIDIPHVIAFYHNDFKSGHGGASRIGPVCRCRYEHHIPIPFSPVLMVFPDHHQTGIFTGGSRVWLERNCFKPCNDLQKMAQLGEQLLIAFGLVEGNKRMQVPELGPAERKHFNSRIQFHRA